MPLLWTARKAVIQSDDPYIDIILLVGLIIVVIVIWAVVTIIKMNIDDDERK